MATFKADNPMQVDWKELKEGKHLQKYPAVLRFYMPQSGCGYEHKQPILGRALPPPQLA